MKSHIELLNPEAKIIDWYRFAQSIHQQVDFNSGADESIPLLVEKIEQVIPIRELSAPQLQTLLEKTQQLTENLNADARDMMQIISWGAAIQMVVRKELNERLEQTLSTESSETFIALLGPIKSLSTILKRSPQELFGNYSDPALKWVTDLLKNYKKYVDHTYTDSMKTKKLNIITFLNAIIIDPSNTALEKIQKIEEFIHQPENQTILKNDSWGSKILSMIRDVLSIVITRTQTSSEIYKEQLLATKVDQANTPVAVETKKMRGP